MKSVPDLFASIFFVIIAVSLMLTYNAASVQVYEARAFEERAIDDIEASHFKEEVTKEWIEKAKSQNYEMKVIRENPYDYRPQYKITLTFRVSMPLIGGNRNHTLEGYAL